MGAVSKTINLGFMLTLYTRVERPHANIYGINGQIRKILEEPQLSLPLETVSHGQAIVKATF